MRRLFAWLSVVSLSAVGLAACGTPSSAPAPAESGTPAQSVTPTPTGPACSGVVGQMTLDDQVGQLFMVGKDSGTPADEAYAAMLRETRTGQVLLLGNSTAGVAAIRELTDRIRGMASEPNGVRVFVAADQEGGRVQRLQGPGFDTIPTAVQQAQQSDAELQASWSGWGGQLKQAGVDVDLAPVADPVPADKRTTNQPVGVLQRSYGESADTVAPKVTAVIGGLHEAGLATSLKHFPGLGRVTGNTDFTSGVVDTEIDANHDDLRAFAAGIQAGSDSVMVSTATYNLIDPDSQATFSRAIVTDLLRDQLRFDGVIISDDLGAAQQVANIPPGERALQFLAAGGDVVINGDPSLQSAMVAAVRERAQSDPAFAAEVRAKATRVVAMKARHGGATCG